MAICPTAETLSSFFGGRTIPDLYPGPSYQQVEGHVHLLLQGRSKDVVIIRLCPPAVREAATGIFFWPASGLYVHSYCFAGLASRKSLIIGMIVCPRDISVTWVVPGSMASLDSERGCRSPETLPPLRRYISAM